MVVITVSKDGKNEFILQIHIVAESGLRVKRLKEYTVGAEVKSLSLFKYRLFLNQEYK